MTNHFRFDYPTFEYFLAAAQLVLLTLGMGVKLRLEDFRRVLCAPRGLVLVFIAQLAFTPIVAVCVDAIFDLPLGFVVGMVLIAAMPTGTLSTVIVYLGRGQMALAVAAMGLTTLASLLTTPTVLRIFGSSQFATGLEMPVGRMLVELSIFLLLPLALGMSLAHVAPHGSQRVGRWCVRGSLLTLTTLVIGSLTSGRLQIAAYGWLPPLALVIFAAAIFLPCNLLGLVAGSSGSESFTVGILSTLRNGNLALLLKARLFPATSSADPVGDAVLFVILFYSGASVVLAMGAALIRRTFRPETTSQPEPCGEGAQAKALAAP